MATATVPPRLRKKDNGTPGNGGEFDVDTRPDAAVTLAPVYAGGATREAADARRDALRGSGFVPAVAGRIVGSDSTTWWNTALVRAEYAGDSRAEYAKLPEDFSLKYAEQGYRGNRRLSRRTYTAPGGVSVTMPSVNTIKAFARINDYETVDIPISAVTPNGDVQGWIRVTKNGPGQWAVSGLGMDPATNAYVSETVNALLESRTVSGAFTGIEDIRESRLQRMARIGVQIKEVPDAPVVLSAVGYNKASKTLAMKIGGRVWGYSATSEDFDQLRTNSKPAAVFNRLFASKKGRVQLHACPKCERVSANLDEHRCPPRHKAATRRASKPSRTFASLLH
ncbi:hypothetical protein [Curtobacterium sp. MCBD17_040]|uniref:hypothetical protein n=1 Tax=Curtobacterium sp. MCBD17_040 TaxID=2175674 RepID=UPI0011B5053D|nr:hypothetical protein [Curtobacterium sp. MCBD17_040]WIB65621.1 hypothetical protein DEI94_16000 [Curtobacterium sp. MCBD17_040]